VSGLTRAVKLLSFKLQDGKTREDAIAALNAVNEYFEQQPGAQSATFMHHEETDTYYVVAPGDSVEALKSQGRAMITSGAGDTLFSLVDPPTFTALDCAVLDVKRT